MYLFLMADWFSSVSSFFESILNFFKSTFGSVIKFFSAITLLVSPLKDFVALNTHLPMFVAPFVLLGFTVLIVKLVLDLL